MKATRMLIDDARWWEFVSSHPDAGPFHLPAWTTVLADCYHFEPFALVVQDATGQIIAGAPVMAVRSLLGRRRWVSLPFSDSCTLLTRPGTDVRDAMAAMAESVFASRVSELEIRTDLPPAADHHPVQVGYIHKIELPPDPHDLHVRKNHRNLSNRARREGVEVVCGRSSGDVATFYRLHTLTRRRLGVPVQPRRFFDLVGDRIIAQGHGFVATALLNGKPVAAALYLSFNGTLISKYHATGAVPSDCGVNHLIDSEAIATAYAEGCHTLDLGRTDRGADGLRLYKNGWSATETPLVYTHISKAAPGLGFPNPGGLSRRVIQTTPPWVTRALGELLYRWTA